MAIVRKYQLQRDIADSHGEKRRIERQKQSRTTRNYAARPFPIPEPVRFERRTVRARCKSPDGQSQMLRSRFKCGRNMPGQVPPPDGQTLVPNRPIVSGGIIGRLGTRGCHRVPAANASPAKRAGQPRPVGPIAPGQMNGGRVATNDQVEIRQSSRRFVKIDQSIGQINDRRLAGQRSSCSRPAPTCKLNSLTPGISASGRKLSSAIERARSRHVLGIALPGNADPETSFAGQISMPG